MDKRFEKKAARRGSFYVYMVRCRDGTYYTGYTTDLVRRLRVHNTGKGSKYLRSRLPARLVYFKRHRTLTLALRDEYRIKQLTHKEKALLVKRGGPKIN